MVFDRETCELRGEPIIPLPSLSEVLSSAFNESQVRVPSPTVSPLSPPKVRSIHITFKRPAKVPPLRSLTAIRSFLHLHAADFQQIQDSLDYILRSSSELVGMSLGRCKSFDGQKFCDKIAPALENMLDLEVIRKLEKSGNSKGRQSIGYALYALAVMRRQKLKNDRSAFLRLGGPAGLGRANEANDKSEIGVYDAHTSYLCCQ
ncbi:hypothetical protein H072_2424 [Dactylellina haptotyla CBS 200.50]|uniref:Uncharacterized protein n=1 Tax=Dactylellina haptotyla (strain CBS 200.50) TaxID=1284197 RepID=S8AKU3_DACHA|nr:hypothetical protein H072_2424 [Dactylellina haptotyla CBS 200.50]